MSSLTKFFAWIVVLMSAVWGINRPTRAEEWHTIDTGIAYKKFSLRSQKNQVVLHALRIDPRQTQIHPVFPGRNQYAEKMRQEAEALVLSNANFFDTSGGPLGLIRINGQTLKPLRAVSWWSVLCIKANRASIVHASQYTDAACTHALQAGPRLVIANSIPKLKSESSRKTAVGIQPGGQLVLVVTEGEIPITELAQFFARPEKSGGLGCPEALNLDGGSSTQLSVKTASLRFEVNGLSRFPVGLGVFAR